MPQRCAALISTKAAPGTQQGFLDSLLSLVVGAEHPVAVQMQSAQMRGYQRLERVTRSLRWRPICWCSPR